MNPALREAVLSIDRFLMRSLKTLAGTPAGRFAVRLWEDSPRGRAQAQRRLSEQIERHRYWLRHAAGDAHADAAIWLSEPDPEIGPGMHARLRALDERRSALDERSPDDPALPEELSRLQGDYERFDELARAVWMLQRVAAAPRPKIEEAVASGGRVRGGRRKRSDPVITPADLEQLQARLAELDRRKSALAARLPDAEHTELVDELVPKLERAYRKLADDAYAAWKLLYPGRAEEAQQAALDEINAYLRFSRKVREEAAASAVPLRRERETGTDGPVWVDFSPPADFGGSGTGGDTP